MLGPGAETRGPKRGTADIIIPMLFLVIERFKNGCIDAVGERFRHQGRMLPEGVRYIDSWVEQDGDRCFQIMESQNRDRLDEWIKAWADLVDFEVVPVTTSAEFWAGRRPS